MDTDRSTDIVHVVEILEATAGGARTHVLQLLRGLNPKRFRVTLVASAERDPRFRDEINQLRASGVEVIEVPMVRRIAPFHDTTALAELCSVLRSIRCDVVHTHASKAGVLGRVAARLCGVRTVIHTPHTFYFQAKEGLVRRWYRAIERLLLRFTDRTVVLGESQRRLVRREFGLSRSRTALIENGVDSAFFSPRGLRSSMREQFGIPLDAPTVGTISRCVPQKGCDVMVRAMAKVTEHVPECYCLFVGEGPLRQETMDLAQRLGIAERFIWRDFSEDPREVYEAVDVFALASRYEGMPYVLLEAMVMGLPVVATAVTGNVDVVVDGETGFLVAPDRPDAFAQALLKLLRDAEKARAMGAAGRARVARRFTMSRFIRSMAALYSQSPVAAKSCGC